MKQLVISLSLALAIITAPAALRAQDPVPAPKPTVSPTPAPSPAKVQYTCTMHPETVSDKPGDCPKCGMKLVPKKDGEKSKTQAAH